MRFIKAPAYALWHLGCVVVLGCNSPTVDPPVAGAASSNPAKPAEARPQFADAAFCSAPDWKDPLSPLCSLGKVGHVPFDCQAPTASSVCQRVSPAHVLWSCQPSYGNDPSRWPKAPARFGVRFDGPSPDHVGPGDLRERSIIDEVQVDQRTASDAEGARVLTESAERLARLGCVAMPGAADHTELACKGWRARVAYASDQKLVTLAAWVPRVEPCKS